MDSHCVSVYSGSNHCSIYLKRFLEIGIFLVTITYAIDVGSKNKIKEW